MKIAYYLLAGVWAGKDRQITNIDKCCDAIRVSVKCIRPALNSCDQNILDVQPKIQIVTNGPSDSYGFYANEATDTTICRTNTMKNGRWTYECDDFKGILADKNPVHIEYTSGGWELMSKTDSEVLDYQYTSEETKCIDHNASGYDYGGYDAYDHAFMSGTIQCLDVEFCGHAGAYSILVGAGSFECEKREKHRGEVHVCKATCDSGKKPRSRRARCRNFISKKFEKNGKSKYVWYNRHNKIDCS